MNKASNKEVATIAFWSWSICLDTSLSWTNVILNSLLTSLLVLLHCDHQVEPAHFKQSVLSVFELSLCWDI